MGSEGIIVDWTSKEGYTISLTEIPREGDPYLVVHHYRKVTEMTTKLKALLAERQNGQETT